MNKQDLLDMLKKRNENHRYDALVFLEVSDRKTGASSTHQIGDVEILGDDILLLPTDYLGNAHPAMTARGLMKSLGQLVPVCSDRLSFMVGPLVNTYIRLGSARIENNMIMISCQKEER